MIYIEIVFATTNAITFNSSKCVARKFFAEPILVNTNYRYNFVSLLINQKVGQF